MTIAMNERQLIEQKDAQIKRSVRNFVRKQVGYGSIKSDRDDLYQECALYIVGKFQRSGKSIGEFKVSDLDLLHCMCAYIQSLLPVTLPKTVRNFTNNVRNYSSTQATEETISNSMEHPANDDDFLVDASIFGQQLAPRERQVFNYLLDGYSLAEISRHLKMPRTSVVRIKERIACLYAQYVADTASTF